MRDYNWDISTEVQHELTQGLSFNGGYYFNTGGYYRNTDSAQRVNNNMAVVNLPDYDQLLRHGAERFAAPRRRWLSDMRSVQRQA